MASPRPWVACRRCGWRGRRTAIERTDCPRCPAGEGDVDLLRGAAGQQPSADPRVSTRVSVRQSTADALALRAHAERRTVAAIAGELLDAAVGLSRSTVSATQDGVFTREIFDRAVADERERRRRGEPEA